MTESLDTIADRITTAAAQIINETGDFALPMRELAARAKVSLRTPYEIFGSKAGVIASILRRDQAKWRASRRMTDDPIKDLLDNLDMGLRSLKRNQPFYRAMYKGTQSHTGSDEADPIRQYIVPARLNCRRIAEAGLFAPGYDADMIAETLTDIFASGLREWANASYDISWTHLRCRFGYATLLAGCTAGSDSDRLRAIAIEQQEAIRAYDRTTGRVRKTARTSSRSPSAAG